jgi:hypothetical protein
LVVEVVTDSLQLLQTVVLVVVLVLVVEKALPLVQDFNQQVLAVDLETLVALDSQILGTVVVVVVQVPLEEMFRQALELEVVEMGI